VPVLGAAWCDITAATDGGHYVPATSHRVYEGNTHNEGVHINLKGVSIGNGLTDPSIQYQYYAQLAYNWSTTLTGEPRVSLQQYADVRHTRSCACAVPTTACPTHPRLRLLGASQMTAAIPKCVQMINDCQKDTSVCPQAEDFCNKAEFDPFELSGYNPYDIRKKCVGGGLCYNFTNEQAWLNLPSVQAALGVSKQWTICNYVVNAGFGHDWMKDYQQDIPAQLEAGTKFLIYAGDCG